MKHPRTNGRRGHNAAPLIDELGTLRNALTQLQQREKEIREQLVDLGPGTFRGLKYDALIVVTERSRLDLKAVRSALGEPWCAQHSIRSTVASITVVPATH
jgi:hypothetical protein